MSEAPPSYDFNEKDARLFYVLLGHTPQERTELRVIEPNEKKVLAREWVNNQNDFLEFSRKWNGRGNVYAGLNPRPSNTASKQDEIKRVTLVPIDVDPERPKDSPSTEEELDLAKKDAQKILEFLIERNFNKPYVAMSGNGIHIILSVDITVEKYEEVRKQIKIFFTKLPVKVDEANCNLDRIFKVPGTWSVKGEHSVERPHRRAFIINEGDMARDSKFEKWLMSLTEDREHIISYQGVEDRIEKGSRNTELFRLAGVMRNKGMDYDEILAALLVTNQKRCDPPLENREVESIAKSIERYTPGERHLAAEIGDVARYFDDIEKSRPVFLFDVMVQDIITDNILITFRDTEDTYVYNAKKGIYQEEGIQTIKEYMLRVLDRYFKKSYAEETIYQIKIKTYVSREEFEPLPELLNLENGILNVKTRELSPHNPKWFFINKSPTIYDPETVSPTFAKLLKDINCPREKTLQEFCGSLLESSSRYKKAGFIYGPTDSGKTTFTNAIRETIGEKCVCSIPIQNLDKRFQKQRLYQMRANICGDLGSEAFSNVGLFRRTTGGDLIEAEIKGANKTLKFVWTGKHFFDANDLPEAKGDADTDAFYNRLLLFPFSNKIEKEKIDRTLGNHLSDQGERSGILNWMLEGLERLEKNQGFTDKTDLDEIRDHYKRASDSVYCFTQDKCEIEQDAYIPKLESHRLYVEYCIEQGFSPKGRSKFYEELQTKKPAIKSDRRKIGKETPHVWLNLKIEGSLVDGQGRLK